MTRITYEELEILVSAYQDGSKDAATQLVKNFDGYFQKFMKVIRNHNFNVADATQRYFNTIFIKGKEHRKNAHLFRKSVFIERLHYRTAFEVAERFAHYSDDELRGEMVVIFLTMAKNHNWTAPFHKYLIRFFPIELANALRRWEQDPTMITHIRFDENKSEEVYYDNFDHLFEDKPPYPIFATEETMYDENWVNGYGCGEIFSTLSIYERRILKWYYEHKTLLKAELTTEDYEDLKRQLRMTEDEIAYRMGCSRKTINLKRNEAKNKVERLALDLHLIT